MANYLIKLLQDNYKLINKLSIPITVGKSTFDEYGIHSHALLAFLFEEEINKHPDWDYIESKCTYLEDIDCDEIFKKHTDDIIYNFFIFENLCSNDSKNPWLVPYNLIKNGYLIKYPSFIHDKQIEWEIIHINSFYNK